MTGLVALAASAAVVFTGVQPHLAASGQRVYVAYGGSGGINVAASRDGGRTFAAPVTIGVPGRMSLGMRRGPRIAATGRAVLVSAIAGERGNGADGDVHLFRSSDGGATWDTPVVINDVPGAAREGMHAMAASDSGLVVIAWLDLREKGTRIYSAVSRDHGATWEPDVLVYASPSGSVCECCHPSVAIGHGGDVAVMFRNSLNGARDMYLVRSADGTRFGPAAKLGTGSWMLEACPMDGGALAFDAAEPVAAWRREDGVYLSTVTDPERRLGPGRDPALAQFGTRRDVAWSTPSDLLLVRDGGEPLSLGRGRFPSLLALADRTVVAWEHGGRVMVRAIPR